MPDPIYKIHPAIGAARVGNASRPDGQPAGWFIGPETPGVPANWDFAQGRFGNFKENGFVKAQAARFRVWEYAEQNGKLTPQREVTLDTPDVETIRWKVGLANRKASFFRFDGPKGETDLFAGRPERNDSVPSAQRAARLEIEEEGEIEGRTAAKFELRNSRFPQIPIPTLGELRTDAQGRLLVLGGTGASNFAPDLPGNFGAQPGDITEYANNDGWFDDVSDGPVSATIRVRLADGTTREIDAEGAWLLVGPPDFAPPIDNVVSLYDTLWNLAVERLALPASSALYDTYASGRGLARLRAMKDHFTAHGSLAGFKPSFTQDIYPVLRRGFLTRWVHGPLLEADGTPNQHHRRLAPDQWTLLSALPGDQNDRMRVFRRLRDPAAAQLQANSMPKAWGDDYDNAPTNSPKRLLSITATQYALFKEWLNGNFHADWQGEPPIPGQEDISPEGLDRAALEACVGGAFYPGIEASWLIRNAAVFSEPFRIQAGAAVGPLAVRSGFFSQQMALPWQADFWACKRERLSGQQQPPIWIAWWPAQRPDDVFLASGGPVQEWAREIDSYKAMVEGWSTRGFVIEQGGKYFEREGPETNI